MRIEQQQQQHEQITKQYIVIWYEMKGTKKSAKKVIYLFIINESLNILMLTYASMNFSFKKTTKT